MNPLTSITDLGSNMDVISTLSMSGFTPFLNPRYFVSSFKNWHSNDKNFNTLR